MVSDLFVDPASETAHEADVQRHFSALLREGPFMEVEPMLTDAAGHNKHFACDKKGDNAITVASDVVLNIDRMLHFNPPVLDRPPAAIDTGRWD